MQEDIDLFCWQVPELKNTSTRKEEFSGGGGMGVSAIYACMWVMWISMKLDIISKYPYFLFFLLKILVKKSIRLVLTI